MFHQRQHNVLQKFQIRHDPIFSIRRLSEKVSGVIRFGFRFGIRDISSPNACIECGSNVYFRLMRAWIANMKFDCRFVFSRLAVRLQHRAVELAYENSLDDFLFPTSATVCSRADTIIPLDKLRDIRYVKLVYLCISSVFVSGF